MRLLKVKFSQNGSSLADRLEKRCKTPLSGYSSCFANKHKLYYLVKLQ